MEFGKDNCALVCFHQGERLRIEPWGRDSLRVRAAMQPRLSGNGWALTEPVENAPAQIVIEEVDHWVGDGTLDKREQATIIHGRIKAVVNHLARPQGHGGRAPRHGHQGDCVRVSFGGSPLGELRTHAGAGLAHAHRAGRPPDLRLPG